jgi:hypothetical protein
VDLTTIYLSIIKEHSHKLPHYFSPKKTPYEDDFSLEQRLVFSLAFCCSSLVVCCECLLIVLFIGEGSQSCLTCMKTLVIFLSCKTPTVLCNACTTPSVPCMHHNMCHSYTTPCVTHTLHHVYIMHLATCHHMQPSILSNLCWPCCNGWTHNNFSKKTKFQKFSF